MDRNNPASATYCYWDPRHPANMHEREDLILHTTARALDAHTPAEPPSAHLDISQIGEPDDRTLWLSFRWSLPDPTSPRLRRAFRLNHLIEAEVIELLSRIPGAKVLDRDPETGRQFNFSFVDGHFGGSMHACMLGVPEAPKTWHVVAIKTVNSQRFRALQKQRVAAGSPRYHAQMQCCMAASGMQRALFVAYNKDTSEIYSERVKPERMAFDGWLARAARIIQADEPPASIYAGPDDFEAKKARATSPVYWGLELPPPNCRNCRFASPVAAGKWDCGHHRKTLATDQQRQGCPNHNYIPTLMPAGIIHRQTFADCVEYEVGGVRFWNAEEIAGAIHEHVYSSRALCHMSKSGLAALAGDPAFTRLREAFAAEVLA